MDAANFSLAADILKNAGYARQAEEARNTVQGLVNKLLTQRTLPSPGWPDHVVELVLREFSTMDSNNFVGNVGAGEREARVWSSLVRQRNYGFAHGIGRSGDISEVQPKAAGSSLLQRLTDALVLDALRTAGASKPSTPACHVLPLCTGMTLSLCMRALARGRENAKYVIWPRVDQKSCFKAISAAGFTPIVLDLLPSPDSSSLSTNLPHLSHLLSTMDPSTIACVVTTTSCFAPRIPDSLPAVAELCARHGVPHLVNNAYGVTSSRAMGLIQSACDKGRVDLWVCSTDKNFLVPVGGAVVVGSKEAVDGVAKTYAGRAGAGPVVDVFVTLLGMGKEGWKKVVDERKDVFAYLKTSLDTFAASHSTRVLSSPSNDISLALSLSPLVSSPTVPASFLGSLLFTRLVSGARVVTPGVTADISGTHFDGWMAHHAGAKEAYLTLAAGVGMSRSEVDTVFERLGKCWKEFEAKVAKVAKEEGEGKEEPRANRPVKVNGTVGVTAKPAGTPNGVPERAPVAASVKPPTPAIPPPPLNSPPSVNAPVKPPTPGPQKVDAPSPTTTTTPATPATPPSATKPLPSAHVAAAVPSPGSATSFAATAGPPKRPPPPPPPDRPSTPPASGLSRSATVRAATPPPTIPPLTSAAAQTQTLGRSFSVRSHSPARQNVPPKPANIVAPQPAPVVSARIQFGTATAVVTPVVVPVPAFPAVAAVPKREPTPAPAMVGGTVGGPGDKVPPGVTPGASWADEVYEELEAVASRAGTPEPVEKVNDGKKTEGGEGKKKGVEVKEGKEEKKVETTKNGAKAAPAAANSPNKVERPAQVTVPDQSKNVQRSKSPARASPTPRDAVNAPTPVSAATISPNNASPPIDQPPPTPPAATKPSSWARVAGARAGEPVTVARKPGAVRTSVEDVPATISGSPVTSAVAGTPTTPMTPSTPVTPATPGGSASHPHDNEVFVNNLPNGVTKEMVIKAFEDRVGSVGGVKGFWRPFEERTFGYVRFGSAEDVRKALEMGTVKIGGREVRIDAKRDRAERTGGPRRDEKGEGGRQSGGAKGKERGRQ